jgi:phosphoglycolate phosphatase
LLLLFDIDGTLLFGATDAHRDALQDALREVHGIDARRARVVAPAGRTDGDIARTILLGAGVSAERIDDRAEAVREHCCLRYARLCPTDLAGTVLPGVRELLDRLSTHDDLVLSLLTGNYEPVARLKLGRAGIGHYFASGQGAFGSDCEDRAALPAIARRRAGERGRPYPREKTVVIGDTPRDIACARADGIRCVAVATGPYEIDQLEQADWAVENATALAELLPELLSD